jgi:hypothetical protein
MTPSISRRGMLKASTTLTGVALAGAHSPSGKQENPVPLNAQEAILDAFGRYEVVGGMSPDHGLKDADDFVISLIRNPALPYTMNDIAVEGGNSLYQPLLDQYIAGGDVPLSQVQQVWQDTTQPNVGYSLLYQELFPLVRRINATLPQARKLRVLACDPPVNWSKIQGPQDLTPFENRDANIAAVMEKQVLSRHRKALMLFGWDHVLHTGGAVAIYEQRYPGVTFSIVNHEGFAKDNDALEKRMSSWPVPSLIPIKGTWLADLDSSYFGLPPGQKGYPGADGYLYLGPRDFLLHQPISSRTVLDKTYIAELQQRAVTLRTPADGLWYPATEFQRETESSVFFYDPAQPQ